MEVYFINLAMLMDIPWGTPSQVTVRDPNYGYSYNAGASGSFGLKIVDGRKLLINLVGTEKVMTTLEVQKYFKDLIVTKAKNNIANELSKYSYNEFNQHLENISERISEKVSEAVEEYGIKIINFFVSAVNIKPDDLEELKRLDNDMAKKRYEALGNRDATVIEAEGMAKAREIQGYTWQQEQQYDVSKLFAQNEGFASNPANMMAQIPIAFAMGNVMKDSLENNMNGAVQNSQSQSVLTCSNCNSKIPEGAKFCMSCGIKVETRKAMFCPECGVQLQPDAKFCMSCGIRIV